ncbi:hypothetical protein C2S52_017418 [Perilla frutescens var. hirtella]|nr:hypothetical protein C2S52_017418 [Perilla frutescens var. hirtella]KAH6811199.1 hypothetical protein C2S51_024961 [Perilla frutescens var. frutescens]
MEQKEKEVVIDIENGDAEPHSDSKWGNKSLNKLVSGILNFNGSSDEEPGVDSDGGSAGELPDETTKLLGGQPKEKEKERRKGGRVKKASKPPRPPKGPTLDAADMRLLKEISRIAIKKRERMERLKALKKMKSPRLSSSLSPSSSPSSPVCSSTATISALFVTLFFFLVLILQGLSSSTGSNLTIAGAPQPAPETTGLSPVQFYKTIMSDDGAAPSFLPPKSA